MDELSIARAARQRGFITEQQFAECCDIAAGGRSLVAILLEMGYLSVAQVAELAAPAPRRNAVWIVAAMLVALLLGFVIGFSYAPAPTTDPVETREDDIGSRTVNWRSYRRDVPFYDVSTQVAVVRRIATAFVDPADCCGEPLAAVRAAHRAIVESPDRGRDTVIALALAEEMMGGDAREAYVELVQRDRGDDDALLGLARTCVREHDGAGARALLAGFPRGHSIADYWRGRAILTEVHLPVKVF